MRCTLLASLKRQRRAPSTAHRSVTAFAARVSIALSLSRGRYGAKVTVTVTPQERNRVAINITIDEGETSKIARINIVGATKFPESELLGLLQLTTPGWMTWYTKNDQYSKQKLSADLE